MSSVVNTISDVVGGAVHSVGNAVSDVGTVIVDNVVKPVANTVTNTVKAAIADPIGTMAKVAAVAAGQPELLPAISAADAVAHGASLEQAALSAGESYVAGQVGSGVSAETGSNLSGSAASGATQAALTGQNPITGALSATINNLGNSSLSNLVNSTSSSGGSPLNLATPDTTPLDTSLSTGQDTTPGVQLTPDTSSSTNLIAPSETDTSTGSGATIPASLTTSPLSSADVDTTPLDTSLTSGAKSNFGVQATPDTSSSLSTIATPTDNSGATLSTSANINSMGGGQGATVTNDQGTTGALGTTTPDSSANLGDPSSFINNPDVLGTDVAPTDTSNNLVLPKLNFANAILPTTTSSNSSKQSSSSTSDKTGTFSYQDPTMSNAPSEFTASGEQALTPDQLKQLYSSLVPELASILVNPSNTVLDTGLSNAKYAEGGLAEINKMLNPAFVKPTEPQVLRPQGHQPAAPMTQLRQMGQGPLSGMIHRAHGGDIHKYEDAAPEGHHPEFITGVTGYYAHGGGTGQSDDIPAMLHDGDYVADADLVAALGDGSSKAGAQALEHFRRSVPHHEGAGGHPVPAQIADGEYVFPANFVTAIGHGDNKAGAKLLDKMREEIRAHKRAAPDTKIPAKAKSPLEYLKMAMKG